MNRLLNQVHQLQVEQFRHDEVAHKDIAQLLVPKRLTHFTLHFAKYQGALVRAITQQDDAAMHRALTDSFIIALAAANAMSINLEKRLVDVVEAQLPKLEHEAPTTLVLKYVEIVGQMAKACEVLDHLEVYPSRTVLEDSAMRLLLLVWQFAASINIDLIKLVRERWNQIEGKLFLSGSTEPLSRHLSMVVTK